jgi:Tfp pilus assembly protein PilN
MLKATRYFKLGLICSVFLMGLYFTGCTKHPNQEQRTALEELKSETLAAEQELEQLKREKADLENQLAKKKAELEKSKQEKELVQQRLESN